MSTCNGSNVFPTVITLCQGVVNEPVCLMCPTDITNDVQWTYDSKIVAQGDFTFGVIEGAIPNGCNRILSSLLLRSCDDFITGTISCKGIQETLAVFRLNCKVQSKSMFSS